MGWEAGIAPPTFEGATGVLLVINHADQAS